MGIRKLGYVGLNVTDLDAWTDLLGRTLGVAVTTEKAGGEEVALAELDDFRYRLALYPGVEDGPRHVGWIVDSPLDLDSLTCRLEHSGFAVEEGRADEAALRGASQFRYFTDPVGHRVEIALGETKVRTAAARAAGAGRGVTGLGHLVLAGPKLAELRDLYETVLQFKLTDFRAPGLYFLRCNPNRHSITLARAEAAFIHHLELEHGSLDDVGHAHRRARSNGVPISIGLGRDMNDRVVSFYVRNPSGFHLELGCDGIEVGNDWLPHDFGVPDVWGHHHAHANPFTSRVAR